MLSHFSHVLLCNSMDRRPPGSSVRGILQARVLEWFAMHFSRGSSRPRDGTCPLHLLCWQAGSLSLAESTWNGTQTFPGVRSNRCVQLQFKQEATLWGTWGRSTVHLARENKRGTRTKSELTHGWGEDVMQRHWVLSPGKRDDTHQRSWFKKGVYWRATQK